MEPENVQLDISLLACVLILQAIKMLVTLMILFCICTVSPMTLKLYSLFAGKFANFNVLETSVYMFRYRISYQGRIQDFRDRGVNSKRWGVPTYYLIQVVAVGGCALLNPPNPPLQIVIKSPCDSLFNSNGTEVWNFQMFTDKFDEILHFSVQLSLT